MPEHDPLILSYIHLNRLARADEALGILKKVASLVKPIMREHGWRVDQLAEFYPTQQNLLGLNIRTHRKVKICLRLRYPSDQNQFFPMENVVDTMLHELCHIVHGPHDAKFHALWDQLRDEWQALVFKGYTGEGFLSEGHRVGGARLPVYEAQRLARVAAEKRHSQQSSGHRLGGAGLTGPSRPSRPGRNLRQAAAEAAEKRRKALEGCATEKLSENEIRDIADTATKNGFRTQAEEDEANDLAIAQALWEMAQEDKITNGGLNAQSSPAEEAMGTVGASSNTSAKGVVSRESQPRERPFWVCSVCTLHNPSKFLCCDACGAERSEVPVSEKKLKQQGSPPAVIDLTASPPKKKRRHETSTDRKPPVLAPPPPPTWLCEICNTVMERQWWTCSTCGRMKTNSR